jgi:hypothetical protein
MKAAPEGAPTPTEALPPRADGGLEMTKKSHSTTTPYCNSQRAKDARFSRWQESLEFQDAVKARARTCPLMRKHLHAYKPISVGTFVTHSGHSDRGVPPLNTV